MFVRYVKKFLAYTFCTLKNYVRGLFPKTFISVFTNPQCRKVLYIEKTWMGELLSYHQYPLKEMDIERIKMEKENLPRLQRIISKYEGENRVATVDKIEKSHT
ncbi:MAG TPA: hypothetical protein DEB74_17045 [Lachnospiraceae bacterium]|nr:hypothetical protein [Lachnospiraceae bacterium]